MLSKTKYSFWHWCLGRRKAEPAILLVLCSSRASPPGCWHAKGFPEVSVSFLPAGTGSGGVWGHRHVDECPAGRVCCKRAAGAPRWCGGGPPCVPALSQAAGCPAHTAAFPPSVSQGSDRPHALVHPSDHCATCWRDRDKGALAQSSKSEGQNGNKQ